MAQQDQAPEPEYKTDDLEFEVELTTDTGVQIPIQFKATYPEGEGLWAIRALKSLDSLGNMLVMELVQRGDASVARAVQESPYFGGYDGDDE